MKTTSKTNWERVDALTDDQIDTSDIPALSDEFFAKARWRAPVQPLNVLVRVTPDTLAWFQAQGEAAEQEMAAALRAYAEARRAHGSVQRKALLRSKSAS